MAVKDNIYNDLGQFEVSCWVCYISWVNGYVASNGDSCSVLVVFLGADLAHYLCIIYLLSSVCVYILVSDNRKVSVLATLCFLIPLSPVPMPFNSLPSLL